MMEDDDLDPHLDGPEDFGSHEELPPEKPSLRDIWENNPPLKLAAIVLGGAILLGVYMIFFAKNDETRTVLNVRDIATAKQVPGKDEVDPAYRKALEEENKRNAEEQLNKGGSALPVPIAIAKGGGLNIPEMPEKPNSDVLEEWKKVANASRMKAAKGEIDEETAPVPEAVPVVQPIRPQQVVKKDPQDIKLLLEQMRVIVSAQAPAPPHSLTITQEDSPYEIQKKAKIASAASTSTSPAASTVAAAGAPAAADQAKTIVPAGSIAYAQLITELNSDIQGPALGQILSGPFAGGRIIGKITVQQEYMIINFTRIVKDAVSYKINAVALDENTTLAGQATDVDHHYFVRLVLPAAASFLTGYASSASQTATSSTAVPDAGVAQDTPEATTKQSMYKGLETASQSVSNALNAVANRPVTVKIAKGTAMGIFFTDSITTKDAEK